MQCNGSLEYCPVSAVSPPPPPPAPPAVVAICYMFCSTNTDNNMQIFGVKYRRKQTSRQRKKHGRFWLL